MEREFNTRTVHQGYIEPQNASALWNADGHLTVWTSTQGAFVARDALAGVLELPVSQIKVVPMEIGGGFGGKIPVYLEPVAALLSRKTGRPVKMQMSRTETFEATGPTAGAYVKIKMGAKQDGSLVAADAVLIYEAGAFPGSSPVTAGAQCVFAPYDLANQRVEGYDVVTNKPRSFAYRAPGSPDFRLRRRAGRGRTGRQVRHGPAGVPPEERQQGGQPPGRWPPVPRDRQRRNPGSRH